MISQYARSKMADLREGRTLEQYLDAAWLLREVENPRSAKSQWKWPTTIHSSNVIRLRPLSLTDVSGWFGA